MLCWWLRIIKTQTTPTLSLYSWLFGDAICIYYFIMCTWLVQNFENKFVFVCGVAQHFFYFIRKTELNSILMSCDDHNQVFLLQSGQAGIRITSAIPILKSETVTSDLPYRLVIVWCSLSCQKEVLVEETLFVSFELHGPTSYHEQCGLALGCLFCERRECRRQYQHFR